jgi:hypothetical protein
MLDTFIITLKSVFTHICIADSEASLSVQILIRKLYDSPSKSAHSASILTVIDIDHHFTLTHIGSPRLSDSFVDLAAGDTRAKTRRRTRTRSNQIRITPPKSGISRQCIYLIGNVVTRDVICWLFRASDAAEGLRDGRDALSG